MKTKKPRRGMPVAVETLVAMMPKVLATSATGETAESLGDFRYRRDCISSLRGRSW